MGVYYTPPQKDDNHNIFNFLWVLREQNMKCNHSAKDYSLGPRVESLRLRVLRAEGLGFLTGLKFLGSLEGLRAPF